MTSGPFVSVVTPFYNTEKYLAQCIESVISQSYTNFEYVLLDNRSTDQSSQIARYYADQDSRIRIHVNDVFLSQRDNYNEALRKISPSSKYCKLVQADDWIFRDCLSHMIEFSEEHPSVGIVGAYGHNGNRVFSNGLSCLVNFFSGREICRLFLVEGIYVFGSQTQLLLRSELIRNRDPFYRDFGYYYDADLCMDLLQNCDFGFVHQVLTFSRVDDLSTLGSIRRYHSDDLVRFLFLIKYGRTYLDRQEFERCFSQTRHAYLRRLGRSGIDLTRKDFYVFHWDNLNRVGYKINKLELIPYVLYSLLEMAGNPLTTLKQVVRWIRRKRKR